MKRKSLIMGVAVWILSVTSIFSSGKINVKAEEKIQEQNAFKWEVSDSYSKTIAQEDYDVINTYYGAYSYCPDKVVFFKDSSDISVNLEQSLYSADNILGWAVQECTLSRNESGKLVVQDKGFGFAQRVYYVLTENGTKKRETVSAGPNFKFDVKPNFMHPEGGSMKLNPVSCKTAYESRNNDGMYTLYKKSDAIDLSIIFIRYVDSDGKEKSEALFIMPDYMENKTVLNFDDNLESNQYVIDISDSQVINKDESETILNQNKTKDIVIKSNNNVTFTFEKGSMIGAEGKDNYDFSSQVNYEFNDNMPSDVSKDNFIMQIKFNYLNTMQVKPGVCFFIGTEYAGKTVYYSGISDEGISSDMLETEVDDEGYINVKHSDYSTYIITSSRLESDNVNSGSESNNANAGEVLSPKTGDNNEFIIYITLIMLSIGGLVLTIKKKNEAY